MTAHIQEKSPQVCLEILLYFKVGLCVGDFYWFYCFVFGFNAQAFSIGGSGCGSFVITYISHTEMNSYRN